MAEKYGSYSPYHFSGNNPLAFVDFNGAEFTGPSMRDVGFHNRARQSSGSLVNYGDVDIMQNKQKAGLFINMIDKDSKSNANTIASAVLKLLQSLTQDKLDLNGKSGKVSIIKGSGDKTASDIGTTIIKDLISNPVFSTTITNSTLEDPNTGKPIDLLKDSRTIAKNRANAQNGNGSSSKIYFDPRVSMNIMDIYGNKFDAKGSRVLGHELSHAFHNMSGQNNALKNAIPGTWNSGNKKIFTSNLEEQNAIKIENMMFYNSTQRYDGTNGKM